MKINKDYLVTDTKKHGGLRKAPVTVLIPHHNAGVASGENVAKYMNNTTRQLSATYIIGQNGEIFQTLDEKFEPYTTGNRSIDTRAITFEIVNSKGAPTWEVSDQAFNALVELSVDICKRHNIKELNYTGDKSGNIHLHEWYANTNCPGPYLKGKMGEYAKRVNEGLNPTFKPYSFTIPKGSKLFDKNGTAYTKPTTVAHAVTIIEEYNGLGRFKASWLKGVSEAWVDLKTKPQPPKTDVGRTAQLRGRVKLYNDNFKAYLIPSGKNRDLTILAEKNGFIQVSSSAFKPNKVWIKKTDVRVV